MMKFTAQIWSSGENSMRNNRNKKRIQLEAINAKVSKQNAGLKKYRLGQNERNKAERVVVVVLLQRISTIKVNKSEIEEEKWSDSREWNWHNKVCYSEARVSRWEVWSACYEKLPLPLRFRVSLTDGASSPHRR